MRRLWWLATALVLCGAALWIGCADENDDDDDDAQDDDDNDDADWTPVPPHREEYERFSIVWLSGSPYEMGYQHGELLHDELAAGAEYINGDPLMAMMIPLARALGLLDLAWNNSYPDVAAECVGLADAAQDVGFTADMCMLLNFGDALMEFLVDGFPEAEKLAPGCSEMAAAGEATVDGKLYHGRILDWSKIDFLLDYPIIFVRQPDDGIPHAYIGFPANLSPYSGINAEGISIASNEVHARDASVHDAVGRSHVQMIAQLLKYGHNMDEVLSTIRAEDHMTCELIMVADGKNRRAAVVEMSGLHVGVRELSDGVVYATNHYLAPETINDDMDPTREANLLRYDRMTQLLTRDGQDSLYGEIDPGALIRVMRDRINPWTGEESPADEFDNGLSLATYGAIYQIAFDPEDLLFWVAAGEIPVPQQPFVGFSLGELLDLPDAVPVEPAVYE